MKTFPFRQPALRAALCMLISIGTAAHAQAADDLDALNLADQTTSKPQQASDWRWFAEAAAGATSQRSGAATVFSERLSLDVQFDKTIAPGWRAVLADRLDVLWQQRPGQQANINSLKEAYLSWQINPNRILDIGRVNARYGVATGYNPTDYFRVGASRAVTSIDPASVRRNRLGAAMLRGQALWDGGALTALYAPKLAEQANSAAFSPDFGATNHQDRWLLAASQQLSENINPQFLLFGGRGEVKQFGFNLAALVNDAMVAHIELAASRSKSQIAQALGQADDSAWRQRVATGLTYTLANNLSLTFEYDYNSAAASSQQWRDLFEKTPAQYGRYRAWVSAAQDLPTRHALFFYGSWKDAFVSRFDLNGMLRVNANDHSRLFWLEGRYHWDSADLALQWQTNRGRAGSEYGASASRNNLQLVWQYFF